MAIDFDSMIKKTIPLGSVNMDDASCIHVAYGIDLNFLYGCGVSVVSLLVHNPEMNFSFHIFIDNTMSDEDITKFLEICKTYNTKVTIYFIDSNSVKKLPTTKNWTHAIYFRFIIAEYFKDKIDYLLYLDADVVCNNNIDEIINMDLSSHVAAVVTERDEAWWQKRADSLGFQSISKGYFNSGIMYLNLRAWCCNNITEKSMSLLTNEKINSKISYPDQDVLNILLTDKILFIKRIFNTQFSLNYELKGYFNFPIQKDTVFIHYVGPTKPWHDWANYVTAQPFLDAKAASPWKNIPLLKAKSSNHLRYCAKHKAKQKKYLQSFIKYIEYFFSKLK
ncbi:glycosyltransferase [Providencia heimbachae]|uniref:UDP-glucose:(Glucosyl)lipopolysaccharide alpha-1,3-glucosyltransferase n=1 Tax=Providencia heimbachae ATCC 35613 TaxID=1354272 RepID=A0A1B7JUR1_9GAMM|nr:glycosyltransferase [Providencia heimbachae]OAT51454.1 UDP-glucose:(glucosyl)lipopolysaccharide alpha-1,3-glucosyltransferase [Providencia heimbachae ATCC 35613]SQH15889.1 Lipopolysaccharide 1,2-glucosyltransferase [Providencia heimbachae]